MREVALRSLMLHILHHALLLPGKVVLPTVAPLWPGAGGGSLPPGRGVRPGPVAALLPVLVARDSLLDPRGRPRLPLVAGAPPSAPIGLDEVAPGVAETELRCARGTPEHLGGVASLPPACSLGLFNYDSFVSFRAIGEIWGI